MSFFTPITSRFHHMRRCIRLCETSVSVTVCLCLTHYLSWTYHGTEALDLARKNLWSFLSWQLLDSSFYFYRWQLCRHHQRGVLGWLLRSLKRVSSECQLRRWMGRTITIRWNSYGKIILYLEIYTW